jgi:hypothetical protein
MVTSSVTSSRRTPAGSGHFTLHSGADKSRTPDTTSVTYLTWCGAAHTVMPFVLADPFAQDREGREV